MAPPLLLLGSETMRGKGARLLRLVSQIVHAKGRFEDVATSFNPE